MVKMEYNINDLTSYWEKDIQYFKIKFSEELIKNECTVFRIFEGKKILLGKLNDEVKTEKWVDYYDNGILKTKEFYKNGKLNGKQENWHDNGNIKSIVNFLENYKHGEFQSRFKNGQIHWEGSYIEGELLPGEYIVYHEDGDIHEIYRYKREEDNVFLKQYQKYGNGHFDWSEWTVDGETVTVVEPIDDLSGYSFFNHKTFGEYKSKDVKIGWWYYDFDPKDSKVMWKQKFYNEYGYLEIENTEYYCPDTDEHKSILCIYQDNKLIEKHLYIDEYFHGERLINKEIQIYNRYTEEQISEPVYFEGTINEVKGSINGVKVIEDYDYQNQEIRIYSTNTEYIKLPDSVVDEPVDIKGDMIQTVEVPFVQWKLKIYKDDDWYRIRFEKLNKLGDVIWKNQNGYYEMDWKNPEDVIIEKGLDKLYKLMNK